MPGEPITRRGRASREPIVERAAGLGRAGRVLTPGPRDADFRAVLDCAQLTGRCGYWTTDHTKVAVAETPSVSVAVTVTV